jgi:putative acetyltransferase
MSWRITPERPDTADGMALIEELETHLSAFYPVESRHGYSVKRLIEEEVAFFILRYNENAVACGGAKLFGSDYAEIKRMYVRPEFRGRGFGKIMITHLGEHARASGVYRLRLETGIHQLEAVRLYERSGFQPIGPFGDYKPDPLSLFYEKTLL